MNTAAIFPTIADGATAAKASGSVGFKDWAVICEALGSGRQSLILRKGGIAEGRDGFRFKHERFFLFSTQFHQQHEKVRSESSLPFPIDPATPETVVIRYFFALDFAYWVDDWQKLARLEAFHVWREDVVRERFDYTDQRGLQCAFGRVYRCETPWSFPNRPSYGGCRSWVVLPEPPPELRLIAALDEGEHQKRRLEITRLLEIR